MLSKIKTFLILCLSMFFVGCASVQMDTNEADASAKLFTIPTNGKVGLYIYRNETLGCGLKKSLWIDGDYLGESAAHVFFYTEVEPGKHIISTESEFGENHIGLDLKENENTYIQQEMKFGVFVGGTRLNLKSTEDGQKDILQSCKKAKNQIEHLGRTRLDYIIPDFDKIYENNFKSEPKTTIVPLDEKALKGY